MSGADIFREVREQKDYQKAIELVPYARFLGITFREDARELLFTLPYNENLIGNTKLPALHGGVLGGFMETAAILHMVWLMDSLTLPKNIDFTIDYILSGRPQDTFAICKVIKQGKNIANVQIEAWQDDRTTPIAIARSHFKIFRD